MYKKDIRRSFNKSKKIDKESFETYKKCKQVKKFLN